MNRLINRILFVAIVSVSSAMTANAACPSAPATVIEVCNDAGGDGTIRAYFYGGDPGVSYFLFSMTRGEYVSDPLGPVTIQSIPFPGGAVAGIEFGLVPDGQYIIRVNCQGGGFTNVGGMGITVSSANAINVGITMDPDCNPDTGGANADGSITLNISGGDAPYDISWPSAQTPIAPLNNVAAGNHVFPALDGGPYTVLVTDNDNCQFTTNFIVPLATVPVAGADQVVCGSTVSLSANTPGPGEIGTWSGPPGVTFTPNSNSSNATASNLSVGINALTWTITDTNGICSGSSDQVDVTSDAPATADAGAAQTICSGATAVLSGTIGGSATLATWTSLGDGAFDNSTSLTATYTPGNADLTAGTVTLRLTTNDPAGPCVAVTDNVVITINSAVTVEAGAAQTICSGGTATLAGSFSNGATGATWTSSGDGSFNNNTSPTAVYTPGPNDITNRGVTLTYTTNDPDGPCVPAEDDVVITINAPATVDAGPAQTICAGSTVPLSGTFGPSASSATWKTSGDGSFDNTSSVTAVYTPGPADQTAQTVTLTLTTNDPAGPCGPAEDNVVITINPWAIVDAGPAQTICADGSATLAATFSGAATSGTWSSDGDGSFDDITSPDAAYTPGPADSASTNVTLRFTTNDPAGPCPAVSDIVVISIDAGAVVDAGAPQTVCAGSTITLAGTRGGAASSTTWTTTGDGAFSNVSALNAVYTPGSGDITSGSLILTLTTNDPAGPCGPVSDNVVMTINAGATVDAGAPQTICSGSTATLAGSAGGAATSGTWTTAGDGSFNDITSATAVYTPGPNDVANLGVRLTFTTDDPAGACPAVNDNVFITINALPVANAGANQTVCSGNTVSLAGSISGSASAATWTTFGDGSFDNASALTAVYTPGPADLAATTVTLTLTTNDPAGPCTPASADVVINFQVTATAEAGNSQMLCPGGTGTLSGSSVGGSATTGAWSVLTQPTGGDGILSNTAHTINPSAITFSATVPGAYTVRLSTDDPAGDCSAAFDDVVITISSVATADAGPSQTICVGGTATLSGTFTVASGITWSTAGDGSFNDPTLANAVYTPGAADISAGSVILTITTGGPCAPVSDNVVITINPAPTVDAGPGQTACSSALIILDGSFGGSATGLVWSSSGDGTFDDDTDPNAAYSAGPNDIATGAAILTATATGSCPGTSDNVTIRINPAAIVDAGDPQTVCDGGRVNLNASISGAATSMTWTTTGDGSFSNVNDRRAVYTPGSNDVSSGTVTLRARTNNPAGPCPAVNDNVVITFMTNVAAITVPASAVMVCEGTPAIDLTGLVSALPSGGVFTFAGTQVTGSNFDPSGLSGIQTITVNYNAGGCVAPQQTFDIDVTNNATITTMNANACQNGSAVNLLTLVSAAPNGGSYTFSGTGVTSNLFNPSGLSGTVNVNVNYNIDGCTDNATLQITVLNSSDPLCTGGNCSSVVIVPKPTSATCTNSDGRLVMSLKPFTPAVNNTGVKITIDGISSTNLPISRTIFNDSIFEALPVGRYTYEIEYGDPACIKTGFFSIDQSGTVGTPIASNVVGPLCPGTATGSLTLDLRGETGNTLEWSLDGGLSDPFKPFVAGSRIGGIRAGAAPTYQHVISVRRNVSDVCYSSVTVAMNESVTNMSATFDIQSATCNGNDGGILNIVASGGHGAPYTYSIDGQSYQSTPAFNGLAGGTYSLRIRDAAFCEREFTALIDFPGFINFVVSKTNADCSNDGASGSVSVTVSDPGVFQVALTTDQFNPPSDAEYISYTNPAVTFTRLPRGEYFVFVKSGTSACPTRSAPINMFGVYDVSFALEADCNDNELSLALVNVTGEASGAPIEIQISRRLSSDPPEIIYQQFPADGEIYLEYDQYAFLKTPGEYRIQLIQFQSEAVCNLPSEIASFTVPVPLNAGIGAISKSYPDIASGKLNVVSFTGGVYPYDVRIELDSASSFSLPSHATDFEEARINGNQQMEMTYEQVPAGRYQVQVMDSLGCVVDLIARVPLDQDLYIPNVFTPNGDGSNDIFFIRNLPQEPANNQLVISNRWGKEVFVAENYQNNWDAERVADGLYFYRLEISGSKPLTGWVEIIRGPKP